MPPLSYTQFLMKSECHSSPVAFLKVLCCEHVSAYFDAFSQRKVYNNTSLNIFPLICDVRWFEQVFPHS